MSQPICRGGFMGMANMPAKIGRRLATRQFSRGRRGQPGSGRDANSSTNARPRRRQTLRPGRLRRVYEELLARTMSTGRLMADLPTGIRRDWGGEACRPPANMFCAKSRAHIGRRRQASCSTPAADNNPVHGRRHVHAQPASVVAATCSGGRPVRWRDPPHRQPVQFPGAPTIYGPEHSRQPRLLDRSAHGRTWLVQGSLCFLWIMKEQLPEKVAGRTLNRGDAAGGDSEQIRRILRGAFFPGGVSGWFVVALLPKMQQRANVSRPGFR